MKFLLYLLATFAAKTAAQDLHTVTIYSRNDFKVLRPCVRNCLFGYGDVAPGAGCGDPYYNQCWCSSNIAISATKHISTCVTSLCSDNVDVSTAVAIYDDYCSGAGYPIAGATAVHIASVDLHTVTIYSRNDFKVLRPCVRNCLFGYGDVAPGAGCGDPYYNQCWCSSNIAVSATSHISTCVTSLCTDNVDVSTAISIYGDYCSGAGYPVAGAKATSVSVPIATTTSVSSIPTTLSTVSNQATTTAISTSAVPGSTILSSIPTATAPSSSAKTSSSSNLYIPTSAASNSPAATSSPQNPNSSTSVPASWQPTAGEIVGIVFAIVFALALLMVLWFFLRHHYPRRPTLFAPPISPPTPPMSTITQNGPFPVPPPSNPATLPPVYAPQVPPPQQLNWQIHQT